MHQPGKSDTHKPARQTQAEIVDSRNCSKADCKAIVDSAGGLLSNYHAMTADEKSRLMQRTAENVKQCLLHALGGSWNVILGKAVQVSVGLPHQCRLFRMACGNDKLFCFETHTKIIVDKDLSTADL